MDIREKWDVVDIFREHKLHCLEATECSIEQRCGRCCIDFFYIFPIIKKINGTIQIFNSDVRVTIRIRKLTNKFRNANIFQRLCKLTLKYGPVKKKHQRNLGTKSISQSL